MEKYLLGKGLMHMLRRVLPLLLTALVLLASCSGNAAPLSDSGRMQELGEEFVAELDDSYIHIHEDDDRLKQTDAVVVIDDKTYFASRLYEFYEDYKVGSYTELISVFKSKTFVVTKIVFDGTSGYYFRYEFDPFDEKAIAVTSQMLDKIEIQTDEKLKKAELTLFKDKMKPLVLSYKNIREEN